MYIIIIVFYAEMYILHRYICAYINNIVIVNVIVNSKDFKNNFKL